MRFFLFIINFHGSYSKCHSMDSQGSSQWSDTLSEDINLVVGLFYIQAVSFANDGLLLASVGNYMKQAELFCVRREVAEECGLEINRPTLKSNCIILIYSKADTRIEQFLRNSFEWMWRSTALSGTDKVPRYLAVGGDCQ